MRAEAEQREQIDLGGEEEEQEEEEIAQEE